MSAFEACVAMGYRHLGTDVRATADGVLGAFHDATLDRTTDRAGRDPGDGVLVAFSDATRERTADRAGRIEAMRWTEVSRARIGGREPVVALEALLGAWPDVRFNLDVKAAGVLAPLVRLVRRLKVLDRLCLA